MVLGGCTSAPATACSPVCMPLPAPNLCTGTRRAPTRHRLHSPLPAPPQVLDLAELDFSRYGDVLFEVAFAGARLTTGGNVATEGKKLDFNVSPVAGGSGGSGSGSGSGSSSTGCSSLWAACAVCVSVCLCAVAAMQWGRNSASASERYAASSRT